MSFFRRRPTTPRPEHYDSAHEWLAALLATGMPASEARRRLRDEVARQSRLAAEAEHRAREREYAARTREGRMMAADVLLREVGLPTDVMPEAPPLVRPSDKFASGEWSWPW